jgi:hypothetical protein
MDEARSILPLTPAASSSNGTGTVNSAFKIHLTRAVDSIEQELHKHENTLENHGKVLSALLDRDRLTYKALRHTNKALGALASHVKAKSRRGNANLGPIPPWAHPKKK